MRIDLFLVPGPIKEKKMTDKTIVLIDVLRASTTICQALNAGARAIIPFKESGEAAEMRAKIGSDSVLLGGERDGVKIEDFDLGNSPLEYISDKVKDKTIILTTSNGTAGYARAGASSLVITGALVNVSTVASRVIREGRDLAVLCAGQKGQFSIEDTICGGMLIDRLTDDKDVNLELNDAASLALLLYHSNKNTLRETIATGEHGRFLEKIGFEADVVMSAETDSISVLPVLKDSRIILENE